MKSERCFLLDTFQEGNNLKLYFLRKNGEKFYLYYKFYPKIQIKAPEKFIKKIPFETYQVIKKDIFLKKDIKLWEVKIPINRWNVWKKIFLFNENIETFNTDLFPIIQFYFENNLFPTAEIDILYKGDKLISIESKDSPFSINYSLPPFKIFTIRPICDEDPKFSKWEGIELSINDRCFYFETIDRYFIETFNRFLDLEDPDLIISLGGDSIILPEIYRISKYLGIKIKLKFLFKKGVSFFSYGKVIYRDKITYIKDKVHIDMLNSFFGKHSGIEGIIEVSRLTSFPLQEAARISPGSSISLMELRTAFKEGFLIPSTKAYPERFKTALELLNVDKGGLYFLPPVGIFRNVAELDFFSMYPSIISKFNISIDTFKCKCCKDIADKIKIPFTNYYFCQKKKGIIPQTIEPLLQKRRQYKEILRKEYSKEIDLRQDAIKWMLVTCFGYLGYKNAKFGCVEAHEATTAAGRFILLKAKEIAENFGFKLIYAITDSLYVYKPNSTEDDYKNLAKEISKDTGFQINLEGIFEFIKFLPATQNDKKAVMNRFFGIYKDGRFKIRGLMCNRRDTPIFIKKFQEKLLKNLKHKKKLEEIFEDYLGKILDNTVPLSELGIKKRISKPVNHYKHNTFNSIIAKQIKDINPGENIIYIVVDEKNPVPEERVRSIMYSDSYDKSYYVKLLKKSYKEIV